MTGTFFHWNLGPLMLGIHDPREVFEEEFPVFKVEAKLGVAETDARTKF